MYANLANELKKNTDIMEMTFKKFNLRVLQYSYQPYSNEDADCRFIIELVTMQGDSMTDDASIKVNLYDEKGEIFFTNSYYIESDDFAGYDTFEINLYNNSNTLIRAKTARVYMSKN